VTARARAVALAIAAAAAACSGARPAPVAPTPAVRAEVAGAEDAELRRRHDLARTRYEQAIADAHDPSSEGFARRNYAQTLASWGEVPAAIAQLERAVAASPADPSAWHDLGILRSTQDDPRGAALALERAKGLAPDDIRPRVALAALRWKAGDRPGALAEYRELLALDLPERLRSKVTWAIDQLSKK